MKKSLLLILALFSFTLANAQGFKFGLKGGWNYSNVTGGDKEAYLGDPDYKNSYHVGAVFLYEINDMVGIKPEVLYTSKGFQLNDKFTNAMNGTTDAEIKTNLNYISVPVLLNIDAGGLYFEFGPEVAFLTGVTGENKVDAKDDKDQKIVDSKIEYIINEDSYSSFDFGYAAGLGYVSNMGLGLGLRYNGGFKSIYEINDDNEPNVKNSTFTLSLIYMFGAGK
jgi:hypothetical protein